MSDSHGYTPLPRGFCPKCAREVALRRGGELREHRRDATTGNPMCVASGLTPVAVENLIKSGHDWRPLHEDAHVG
jgi:hypothetical protein